MPIYIYACPKTGKTIELVQGMNDKHEYTDESGVQWKRVFFSPNMNVDCKIDAFSAKEFNERTKSKNCKLGDMWDLSAELSEKRKKILGHDPKKEKVAADYKKKTKMKHPHE